MRFFVRTARQCPLWFGPFLIESASGDQGFQPWTRGSGSSHFSERLPTEDYFPFFPNASTSLAAFVGVPGLSRNPRSLNQSM